MCLYIVTDEQITKAEEDIFGIGKHFNEEQKAFLRCLDSCCLQAYAGTGKTSSIVGKLHILAQNKAWAGGTGICVISHTNVAVDEIKKYVGKHYPEVMGYPNFVGTIQEFVNKFLFIPYLAQQGIQIKYQDERRYLDFDSFPKVKERINNYRSTLRATSAQRLDVFNKSLGSCFMNDDEVCVVYNKNEIKSFLEVFPKLITKTCKKEEITGALKIAIDNQRKAGAFLYIESFIEANEYLKRNKVLEDIIRKRFNFVFLDEAQDCSAVQLEILNTLFGKSNTVFQQIGDENQSISEDVWTPTNVLYLGVSERVKNNLATFINYFKVDAGSGISANLANSDAKLFLILYEEKDKSKILPKYAELLIKESVPNDKEFFAIAYQHGELSTYHENYSEVIAKNKSKKTHLRLNNDTEYIELLDKEGVKNGGAHFVSSILTSLLFRHYKKGGGSFVELKRLLREGESGDIFKRLVFDISKNLLGANGIGDGNLIKNKLNEILGEEKVMFADADFLSANEAAVAAVNKQANHYRDPNGITIKIGTVHSVKGQTHNATLYFSNRDNGKQDIQHVLDNTPAWTPKFKKLLYVASSRAKYLFAIAIEKSIYEALANKTYFDSFTKIEI